MKDIKKKFNMFEIDKIEGNYLFVEIIKYSLKNYSNYN